MPGSNRYSNTMPGVLVDNDEQTQMQSNQPASVGAQSQDGGQTSAASPSTQPKNYIEDIKFDTNSDVANYLASKVGQSPEESASDKARRLKRERAQGIISGIADMGSALGNLYFTTQYAPNSYDATQGMSARQIARLQKAKEDRAKKRDEWLNYATMLTKLNNDKASRELALAQAKQAQANAEAERQYRDKVFDYNKAKDEAERQYRDKVFDYNQKKDDRSFTESQRQFNANYGLQRQTAQGNVYTINLGGGQGFVDIPINKNNYSNWSTVYYQLPPKFQKKKQRVDKGVPVYDKDLKPIYEAPDANIMMRSISVYLADTSVSENDKKTIREELKKMGKVTGGQSRGTIAK